MAGSVTGSLASGQLPSADEQSGHRPLDSPENDCSKHGRGDGAAVTKNSEQEVDLAESYIDECELEAVRPVEKRQGDHTEEDQLHDDAARDRGIDPRVRQRIDGRETVRDYETSDHHQDWQE